MTLSSYIRDRFEEFSRSQKDVARYIVDHLEEAAFQTAEELARRADTSSSTVVRFSQALGFEGFPELQEAARDEYKRRSHAPAAPPASGSRVRAADARQQRVRDRARDRPRQPRRERAPAGLEDVQEVAGLITRAERIVMVGVDQMAFFASYLRHLLALLDLRARSSPPPARRRSRALPGSTRTTLVIAFCSGRPHALVLRAAKLARKRDCATVAISDASISELTKLSRPLPVLLVEQPVLHALARRAAVADPGARVRRVRQRRGRVPRAHPGLQAEVSRCDRAGSWQVGERRTADGDCELSSGATQLDCLHA